jgi:excisionase family DNA binding protein
MAQTHSRPKLLDIDGLADYLGVPRTWVRDMVTARQIPFRKIGRHVRFHPDDVAEIEKAAKQPALSGPLAPR